jgi:hypothetical protein
MREKKLTGMKGMQGMKAKRYLLTFFRSPGVLARPLRGALGDAKRVPKGTE